MGIAIEVEEDSPGFVNRLGGKTKIVVSHGKFSRYENRITAM